MQEKSHIKRLRFIMVLIILMWLVLWEEIGVIQCFRHQGYHEMAINQRIKPVTLTARRGYILDRNGIQLAVNLPSASYGIRPEEVEDIEGTAYRLSMVTGINLSSIKTMLASQKNFFWLIRQTHESVEENLDSVDIMGLEKLREFKRYYPLGKVGAQVIGYTDIDSRGIEGYELYVDDELSGWNGRSLVFKDAKGKAAQSLDDPDIEPQDGLDVILTIDWRIQDIADEELEESARELNAEWGGAIVLDTVTGEILAMSNVPRFDPNDPDFFDSKQFNPRNRLNRLVMDMMEPGSTFKIVTFIEAIESGLLDIDDPIDCENGKYKIGRHIINDTHELGIVPVRDVLVHSSNIGSVKIAEMVGKHRLYERSRLLGFGSVTGIDFPNETEGRLPDPRKWSKLSLPTISFGQGVAVSPIQLAVAYAAVANGGYIVRPHIIKEVIGKGERPGRVVKEQKIRRSMTGETAELITELLCEAVESGTGKAASLPNVRIAGKTGTAQRVREGEKGYEPGRYISSFVGFVTDLEPKILCLVIIDSPKGLYYGSQVAAPVFRKIVNRMLNMRNGPWTPTIADNREDTGDHDIIVPNLKGIELHKAVARLRKLGLSSSVVGDSTTVAKQLPQAGAKLNKGSSVTLYSYYMPVERGDRIRVPDLRGKTVREAVQNLVQANLTVSIMGSGIVSTQNPSAGTLVEHGTQCIISCKKK